MKGTCMRHASVSWIHCTETTGAEPLNFIESYILICRPPCPKLLSISKQTARSNLAHIRWMAHLHYANWQEHYGFIRFTISHLSTLDLTTCKPSFKPYAAKIYNVHADRRVYTSRPCGTLGPRAPPGGNVSRKAVISQIALFPHVFHDAFFPRPLPRVLTLFHVRPTQLDAKLSSAMLVTTRRKSNGADGAT